LSGNVTINRPEGDPSRGITQLPAVTLDATNQIAQRCSPGSQGGTNGEFVVTGRGGRPTTPTDILDANRVLDDLGDASFPSDTPSEPVVNSSRAVATPSLTEIVEAQGWITDADGNVVLVADAATTTPHDEWEAPLTCAAATPSSS
jgi:large exoprotein involved in heme utilization and adhesion